MKKIGMGMGMILLSVVFSGCDVLTQVASSVGTVIQTSGTTPTAYTNAAGLKEALQVGLTNSVRTLNQTDAFLADAAMKILLPEDAQVIVEHIQMIPGGNQLVSDVVLRLNRAAEDAVVEAKPIFASAIRSMSFSDATSILFGGEQAATNYFKQATYNQLYDAFLPKMQSSLSKDLVGGVSTQESWSALTVAYNNVAKSTLGQVAGLKSVTTDLSVYATRRTLDGLFLQVAEEENKIRQDPKARVTNLLQQVFGQLDQ